MSSFTECMNEKEACKTGQQESLDSAEDVEKVTRMPFKEADE